MKEKNTALLNSYSLLFGTKSKNHNKLQSGYNHLADSDQERAIRKVLKIAAEPCSKQTPLGDDEDSIL